jgi:3',5'-cyclic AMP phosphodiesterase CpdA
MNLDRRNFLRLAGATGLAWALPLRGQQTSSILRLGVGADLHQDLVPDAPERLAALQKAAREFKADAVVQLGDFCKPIAANLALLKQWREGPKPQIDVIGNHDMDGGSTPDKTAAWMGMPGRYHTSIVSGHRIIVLDGNEKRPDRAVRGYPRAIGDAQLGWLEKTLGLDDLPVVVCCHQGLDGMELGVVNSADVRALLEKANAKAGRPRIRLVLTGHHHLDYLAQVKRIPYLQVNSFSYYWTDKKTPGGRFPADVEARYPYLKQVLVYDQPLFALVELTPKGGRVLGRAAKYVAGYGPAQAGIAPLVHGHPIVSTVSPRTL